MSHFCKPSVMPPNVAFHFSQVHVLKPVPPKHNPIVCVISCAFDSVIAESITRLSRSRVGRFSPARPLPTNGKFNGWPLHSTRALCQSLCKARHISSTSEKTLLLVWFVFARAKRIYRLRLHRLGPSYRCDSKEFFPPLVRHFSVFFVDELGFDLPINRILIAGEVPLQKRHREGSYRNGLSQLCFEELTNADGTYAVLLENVAENESPSMCWSGQF